jgi:hypothetical protein
MPRGSNAWNVWADQVAGHVRGLIEGYQLIPLGDTSI